LLATSEDVAEPKPTHRSAVSNGSRLLPEVDGRSVWARRCRDLIDSHLADLGGEDSVSEAERSIIRRAAVMTTELERLETEFANKGAADKSDLDLYSRVAGNLRRLLESVGLERRAKDVTPLRERLISARRVDAGRGDAP
jgi:hypothetical protein